MKLMHVIKQAGKFKICRVGGQDYGGQSVKLKTHEFKC